MNVKIMNIDEVKEKAVGKRVKAVGLLGVFNVGTILSVENVILLVNENNFNIASCNLQYRIVFDDNKEKEFFIDSPWVEFIE